MTEITRHEKERQSLGSSMRKFLLGTTANNLVSTDSVNRPEYLGQTTMRDGAHNPLEKADIAAPKSNNNKITCRSKVRLGVKGKVPTNQK